MKNIRLMGCMLMAVMGSGPLMAAPILTHKEWQDNQVISLLDLNESVIQDFTQGKMGDYILKCPEGACLPLKMTLKGQFLALESTAITPLYLKILKTCYVRCETQENFLFSTDLQTWKGFSEFFTGALNVSVDHQNGGPVAGVELELNQRKSS